MKHTRIDVDLDEGLGRFIDGEVAEGRFRTANEVVEAALELLKEREVRLAALRSIMAQMERAQRAAPPDDRKPRSGR